MEIQIVSIGAAIVVLYAFWMQQQGRWRAKDRVYLLCNCLGTLVLTGVAWVGSQWGFVLVEGVWCLVSLWNLVRRPK